MQRVKQFSRVVYINYILARNGIDEILLDTAWFSHWRFLRFFNPWRWSKTKQRSYGERIRLSLEELGPIFVKFGQMLSTRGDLLPNHLVNELAKLQDQVPPFAVDLVQKIIFEEYQQPASQLFATFDTTPLASASIAQVHAATLKDGTEVVVKVLRPNIETTIRRDIAILYTVARLLERFSTDAARLRPLEVVAEFEYNILNELDLMREAANASQLRRNFKDSPHLYVPEIYWPYARSKVLVMERIYGVPISDIATLKQHKINLKQLAETGVDIFFTQVFRDCFFHADMHPGNIFVSLDNPEQPQYLAVDFGIMGTLTKTDQRYLAENFLAFFNRDYNLVAQLHLESGWVPRHTRIEQLEAAIRTVCEPMFERPLKDLSVGIILLRLFQTARQFNMEIQPQLVLLQKTLLNVEGLGRQLYPDLDLWSTAKPFLVRWLHQQMGARALFKKIKQNAPFWLEKLPDMPGLIYEVLQTTRQQQALFLAEPPRIFMTQLRRQRRAAFILGIGVSALGAVLAGWLFSSSFPELLHYKGISWSLAIMGVVAIGFSWRHKTKVKVEE